MPRHFDMKRVIYHPMLASQEERIMMVVMHCPILSNQVNPICQQEGTRSYNS